MRNGATTQRADSGLRAVLGATDAELGIAPLLARERVSASPRWLHTPDGWTGPQWTRWPPKWTTLIGWRTR